MGDKRIFVSLVILMVNLFQQGIRLQLKGYLYIIAAAGLWGILGPFSRLAFSQGLAPMEVAFWRAALAWGFFGTHALVTKTVRLRLQDIPMVLLFAITGVTLFYGTAAAACAG